MKDFRKHPIFVPALLLAVFFVLFLVFLLIK
jgi:hypothetical protein